MVKRENAPGVFVTPVHTCPFMRFAILFTCQIATYVIREPALFSLRTCGSRKLKSQEVPQGHTMVLCLHAQLSFSSSCQEDRNASCPASALWFQSTSGAIQPTGPVQRDIRRRSFARAGLDSHKAWPHVEVFFWLPVFRCLHHKLQEPSSY